MADVSLPPVGAVVAKRCTCGAVACHRDASTTHPRYLVVCKHINTWVPPGAHVDLYADYHLERIGDGRRHRTSGLVLRDQYVILSLPTEGLMVS